MSTSSGKSVIVVGSCIAVATHLMIGGVNGGLALSKVCRDTTCGSYEYCNSDDICDECSKICDITSNNFEKSNCERNCQDYIHDHISSYVNATTFAQLQGSVQTLQTLAVTSLTLSIFLLFVVGILLLAAWYRYRRYLYNNHEINHKSNEVKQKISSINVISNNNDSVSTDTRLSLKIPPPIAESEQGCPPSAVTTTTPLSTRHPSEDNTLEYAYDNPALTPSPGINLKRTETTF